MSKKSIIENQRGHEHENRWKAFYFNQLQNIVYQMFEWRNLPKTIEPRFVERFLHSDGHIAFWDHPLIGKMAFSGSFTEISPYQEPLRFQSNILTTLPQFNQVSFDLHTYIDNIEQSRDLNKGVFCSNMFSHLGGSNGLTLMGGVSHQITTSLEAVDLYSTLLADNKTAYIVATQQLKIPFILKVDQNHLLSAKNMVNKLQQNSMAIFLDKDSTMVDEVKVLPTFNPAYINVLDKLEEQRKNYIIEFLNYFGIYHFESDKKERLITSEVSSSLSATNHQLNKFLMPRMEAAKIMNELWQIPESKKITVNLRDNILMVVDNALGLKEETLRHDHLADGYRAGEN